MPPATIERIISRARRETLQRLLRRGSEIISLPRRLALALGFLALHAAALRWLCGESDLASYPFALAAPLLCALASVRLAVRASQPARSAWALLASGFALWTLGMATAAWADLVSGDTPYLAGASDFVYFLYGAPILVAVTLPDETELIRRFFWFDAAQAALAAVLAYVAIFHVVPFTRASAQPMPTELLIRTYDAENAGLMLLSWLRLPGRWAEPERRRFDRQAALFLTAYAVCAGAFNQLSMEAGFQTSLLELLPDLPFLALLVQPGGTRGAEAPPLRRRTMFELLVDGAGPAFSTLALLGLGVIVARERLGLGMAAVAAALALHVARSALLQSRYLSVQEALREARDGLERLSLQDGLTGVANRRRFDLSLRVEWDRAARNARPLSLLLADVDRFKDLNDVLGHQAGDECLARIARAMAEALPRRTDLLARYGGEEFAVLLPETGPEEAASLGLRLCEAVRALRIANPSARGGWITVSVGAAARGDRSAGAASLVEAADRALYAAKSGGRDRVVGAAPPVLKAPGVL